MNDWFEWIGCYLLAGILLFLVIRLTVWLQQKGQKEAGSLAADIKAVIKSLEPEKTFKDRILEGVVYLMILMVWPVAIIAFAVDELKRRFKKPKPVKEGGTAEYSWGDLETGNGKTEFDYGCWLEHLKEEARPDDVEMAHIIADPLNKVPSVPFGFLNGAWLAFREDIQQGDEVWSYAINKGEKYGKHDYTCEGHIAGYALVRDGKIANDFAYEMD